MSERERKTMPECIEQLNKAFDSIKDAIHDMVDMDCKITITSLDGRVMAQSIEGKPN